MRGNQTSDDPSLSLQVLQLRPRYHGAGPNCPQRALSKFLTCSIHGQNKRLFYTSLILGSYIQPSEWNAHKTSSGIPTSCHDLSGLPLRIHSGRSAKSQRQTQLRRHLVLGWSHLVAMLTSHPTISVDLPAPSSTRGSIKRPASHGPWSQTACVFHHLGSTT